MAELPVDGLALPVQMRVGEQVVHEFDVLFDPGRTS